MLRKILKVFPLQRKVDEVRIKAKKTNLFLIIVYDNKIKRLTFKIPKRKYRKNTSCVCLYPKIGQLKHSFINHN